MIIIKFNIQTQRNKVLIFLQKYAASSNTISAVFLCRSLAYVVIRIIKLLRVVFLDDFFTTIVGLAELLRQRLLYSRWNRSLTGKSYNPNRTRLNMIKSLYWSTHEIGSKLSPNYTSPNDAYSRYHYISICNIASEPARFRTSPEVGCQTSEAYKNEGRMYALYIVSLVEKGRLGGKFRRSRERRE